METIKLRMESNEIKNRKHREKTTNKLIFRRSVTNLARMVKRREDANYQHQ